MPAVIDLHDRRRGFKIPKSLENDAYQYVQRQNVGKNRHPEQAPFPRMVDFWFASIMYAVAQGIEPDPDIPTVTVNDLGSGRDQITLDDWQADLLTVAALAQQDRLTPEDADASSATIVRTGNELAVPGMLKLYEDLSDQKLDTDETPLSHLLTLLKHAGAGAVEEFRTPAAAGPGPDEL